MIQRTVPLLLLLAMFSCNSKPDERGIEDLKLRNYRPNSIYNIPKTNIETAAFPVIDMHSHDYAANDAEVDQWVETMEKIGIEKTVILSYQTGPAFDSVINKYSRYPDKFEIWCGLDYTGYDTDENWSEKAINELERCYALGARGVGELGDKGEGLLYSKPTPGYGLHMDDPRLQPVWARCAQLGMPVNVHVAEPIWMYEPMDSTNDGLMNAYTWRVDLSDEQTLDHGELMQTLENVVRENPKTTFIACHFANCSYDLSIVGRMLDKYPNLWLDNSARYAETAPIPRFVKSFYEKYSDRILYGTDMGMAEDMYKVTLRILESEDEHFYEFDLFGYHWALNGIGLPEDVLRKIYRENALKMYEINNDKSE